MRTRKYIYNIYQNNLRISGPAQLKPVLFKGQLQTPVLRKPGTSKGTDMSTAAWMRDANPVRPATGFLPRGNELVKKNKH